MAQGSKGAAGHPPASANGPSTPSSAPAVSSGPAVNKKKQKRRQKQAAKDASAAQQQPPPSNPPQHTHGPQNAPHYQEFDDDDSEYGYGTYDGSPEQVNGHVNGHASASDAKKKSKKKKDKPVDDQYTSNPSARPSLENVWNITKSEERNQIKAFWISLSDEERKSLLVLEKNSVLKTMRETSARQTCSCTICGRRRIAIEAELESMYEQYFNDLQECGCPSCQGKDQHNDRFPHNMPADRNGALHDEGYDEVDDDDDDLYTDDGYREALRGPTGHSVASEMFHLGQNLAVKGTSSGLVLHPLIGADGILTVADDLLENEGKRFIDMMEQLAERRLARQEEAQFAAHRHTTHDSAYADSHEGHEEDDDDLDDDEDYDDEEGDEEEVAEVVRAPDANATADPPQDPTLEHDRTQEGRRMFHLFAARMFEQRVFVAYKAKVAHDRQQRLLMELEEEKTNDVQREAKKQRDAQNKNEKKQQQQQAKAEEKARKEAEKKAEEDAAKAEEARTQDEVR